MGEIKLLGCPFCGSDAHMRGPEDQTYFVACTGPDCFAAVGEAYDRSAWPEHMFREPEDAAAAWNTRAPSPEAEAVRVPEGWRPIETAPRNVSILVLYDDDTTRLFPADENYDAWLPYPGLSDYCSRPKFWMPIPASPQPDGGAKASKSGGG